MRIGVISDTHGLLRPEVMEILSDCDMIMHAGDIDNRFIVQQLEKTAPLCIVRGNMDGEWARDIPKVRVMDVCGKSFYIIHNADLMDEKALECDFVIFGHTHKFTEMQHGRTKLLNPGSCGRERYGLPPTMAVIELDESGECEITCIELPTLSPL